MSCFVVIATSESTRSTAIAALEAAGASVIGLESLAELPDTLKRIPVNGILLDMVTSAKASPEEKKNTNDLIQIYPHAKFRITDGKVKLLGRDVDLESFVQLGSAFHARIVRSDQRVTIYTGVYISRTSDFREYRKEATINMSKNGCFIYSTDEWQVGERVWLCFKNQDYVLAGEVRWQQPWGNNKRLPGIGILFDLTAIYPLPSFLLEAGD